MATIFIYPIHFVMVFVNLGAIVVDFFYLVRSPLKDTVLDFFFVNKEFSQSKKTTFASPLWLYFNEIDRSLASVIKLWG